MDNTTPEFAEPAEPPVPRALLELFGDGEAQAVQGEPPPLPCGPTAAQLRERARRIQRLMMWARVKGCPTHLLSRGWWAVESCKGWFREFGTWPTADEFLTASGIDGTTGFTKWDRPAGEPMRRKVAVYEDGRWNAETAARWNECIYREPSHDGAPGATSHGAPAVQLAPATRPRGAGRPKVRGASRRSSAKSGDSGDDSEGGSEPPGRLCACGCRSDISHRAPQAKYLNDTHANADRQRRKRSRDWSATVTRRDPYLQLDALTLEQLRRRIETGCRCNGHHIADAADGHCTKCGHRRGWALPSAPTIAAGSAETRRARKAAA